MRRNQCRIAAPWRGQCPGVAAIRVRPGQRPKTTGRESHPLRRCSPARRLLRSQRRPDARKALVDEKGSIGRKSTVPAMVVFRPSVGKRVIVRMPDSPADSLAQLSDLPAPNEVTTPMPVTTTMGRPNLSRFAVMVSPQLYSLDQRHAFAAPVASPDHHNLGRRLGHFNLYAAAIVCRDTTPRARSTTRQALSRAGTVLP